MDPPDSNVGDLNDLVKALTDNIKNVALDDISRVIGIKTYGGLRIENQPNATYDENIEHDLEKWLQSIEAKTRVNFTDQGRIQVALKYSKGTGRSGLDVILQYLPNPTWEEVKKALLELFGKPTDVRTYRKQLYEIKFPASETIVDFYVKLSSIAAAWMQLKPGDKVEIYNLMIDNIIRVMPFVFKYKLTEEDYKYPQDVFNKCIRYLEAHPGATLKHDPEEIKICNIENKPATNYVPRHNSNGNRNRFNQANTNRAKACFRCGDFNHWIANCPQNFSNRRGYHNAQYNNNSRNNHPHFSNRNQGGYRNRDYNPHFKPNGNRTYASTPRNVYNSPSRNRNTSNRGYAGGNQNFWNRREMY